MALVCAKYNIISRAVRPRGSKLTYSIKAKLVGMRIHLLKHQPHHLNRAICAKISMAKADQKAGTSRNNCAEGARNACNMRCAYNSFLQASNN